MINILDDFRVSNGIEHKMALQVHKQRKEKVSQLKKTEEVAQKSELEKIDELIGQLENASTRKDRRRLMGLYKQKAQTQVEKAGALEAHAWGEMPSYRARAKERQQKKLAQDDNKVFNPATNSWVDQHDFEVASKPDTRNPNVREGANN